MQAIEEKMKISKDIMKKDSKQRILKQFDQLRDYYRVNFGIICILKSIQIKQDRLMMQINDLESKQNFHTQDKIDNLNNLIKTHKANYDSLLKKYTYIKHICRDKDRYKRKDESKSTNISLNISHIDIYSNPNTVSTSNAESGERLYSDNIRYQSYRTHK